MFFRIIIAGLLLVLINAAVYIPGLETVRGWVPAVSLVIGIYLLCQSVSVRNTAPAEADAEPVAAESSPAPAAPKIRDIEPEAKAHLVQFLGVLQEKGRFLDFVMDDVGGYSDEQIGAAARVVHQGCGAAVREHFAIAPVHSGNEGESVTLESGYNASEFRAVGKLAGSPPFHGTLLHKGWKAEKVDLPRLVEKPSGSGGSFVIAPAEVEVKS